MESLVLKVKQEKNGIRYYEFSGKINTYRITVIELPKEIQGVDWGGPSKSGGHYKVINENENKCYNFFENYFDGTNTNYMPVKLGIKKEDSEEFMEGIKRFVYTDL